MREDSKLKNSAVFGVSVVVAIILLASLSVLTYQKSEFETMAFKEGDYLEYDHYEDYGQTNRHLDYSRYTVTGIQGTEISWNVTGLHGPNHIPEIWYYNITTLKTNITPDNFNVAHPNPWQEVRYLGNETVQTKWGEIDCAKYHMKIEGYPTWYMDFWVFEGVEVKKSGLLWENPWPGAPLLTWMLIDTNIQEIIDH